MAFWGYIYILKNNWFWLRQKNSNIYISCHTPFSITFILDCLSVCNGLSQKPKLVKSTYYISWSNNRRFSQAHSKIIFTAWRKSKLIRLRLRVASRRWLREIRLRRAHSRDISDPGTLLQYESCESFWRLRRAEVERKSVTDKVLKCFIT